MKTGKNPFFDRCRINVSNYWSILHWIFYILFYIHLFQFMFSSLHFLYTKPTWIKKQKKCNLLLCLLSDLSFQFVPLYFLYFSALNKIIVFEKAKPCVLRQVSVKTSKHFTYNKITKPNETIEKERWKEKSNKKKEEKT